MKANPMAYGAHMNYLRAKIYWSFRRIDIELAYYEVKRCFKE